MHSSRQPVDGNAINQCRINNGNCSHLCLLSVNQTYKCECPHVMRLDKDNITCIQNEQILLIVTASEIRGVDLHKIDYYTIPVISHLTQVVSIHRIDYIVSEKTIFWTDGQLNEVKKSRLTNGPIETILDTDIENPNGFAIDWVSGVMYVTTGKLKYSILACNLKGEFISEILSDMDPISSIALDPANGKMFFTSGDESHRIEYSALDGSKRTALYESSQRIESLSIDFSTKRLYFIQPTAGNISYWDLTTNTITNVYSRNDAKVLQYSSITIYKNNLYFVDNKQHQILKCSKDNCEITETIRNNTSMVYGIKMYFPEAQNGTNTCAFNRGGCQHLCLAISSTNHVCKCAIGFRVDPIDVRKCIGYSEFILYSVGHELRGIPTNHDHYEGFAPLGPISRISHASNIDYHYDSDFIFWSDTDKSIITRIKRDGTNRKVILAQQPESLDSGDWLSGIAIDWIGQNIYWSDKKRGLIEIAKIDGSFRYVVLSNLNSPTSIAIDPIAGFLFYASNTHIGRTGLDGSSQFILVNQTSTITSLFLDMDNQVVYWSETSTDTIMKVDYDGNLKYVLLNQSLENPIGITKIDGYVFWADNTQMRHKILKAPVRNNVLSNIEIVLESQEDVVSDLKLFSKRLQKGFNLCGKNNGDCEELCLFNGTHPICACSKGQVAPNKKSCENQDSFIVYSRVFAIESIHITDQDDFNSPIEKIQNSTYLKNAIGLSYDYSTETIFYSDIHFGSINAVHFNGTGHTVIVNKQVSVEGLAFDEVSKFLFWTSNHDASIRKINVQNLTGNTHNNTNAVEIVVKLKIEDKPRGIAVEPCLTMIYWTNWNNQAASIQRSYITGYGVESIITTDIKMPNALTIDYEDHKLYWADARLDKIERTDYDGTHRFVLAHSVPKHPFSIAVYGNLLYWTDWVLHAVIRANKFSGHEVVFLRKDIGRPMGIVAVQNTSINCSANKCQILNGGCEDVCTINQNNEIKCQCTQGILTNDGKRCTVKPTNFCTSDQFECRSGICIPYTLTCDGINHCPEGSDESIEFCNDRKCPKKYFQCNNHRCIEKSQTCDGIENCGDGSDETICNCTKNDFRCNSGLCIAKKYRCDFDPDCPDASDEMGCNRSCAAASDNVFYHCPNTTACYMKAWLCDGENDCWDNSDEANCTESATKGPCPSDKFQCGDGRCIPNDWLCDNNNDCADGSDEQDCDHECKINQFKCAYGFCIPSSWQCDNHPDCR